MLGNVLTCYLGGVMSGRGFDRRGFDRRGFDRRGLTGRGFDHDRTGF